MARTPHAPSTSGDPKKGAWRLAASTSAYLREASGQAIEWHPWGPEPFELAKRWKRPVLLDIGAAWCHWCHVMDEGTYSDPEVARLVNTNFVAVKVDRDENPEVDRRYQKQVGALTGEGGWPLTAFLSPDGETFLGGTYFPVQDMAGRPGFRRVLGEVARLWKDEPTTLRSNTQALHEALARMAEHDTATKVEVAPFLELTDKALQSSFDPSNGGWGHAPKFPHPTAIAYLLFRAWQSQNTETLRCAQLALGKMAEGGIYDHLGGGFHRYSVDEGWHIPHFEKMSVDNAHLLSAYVDAATATGDARFPEVVRGIVGYALTTLSPHPDGGLAASQDADNAPGDDGSYYTWSRAQLKSILTPDEVKAATWRFGLGAQGRMHHDPDQNVLYLLLTPAEVAKELKVDVGEAEKLIGSASSKMLAARAGRPRPFVDPARYASLNGPWVGGLALASRLLNDPRPLASARQAADLFLSRAYDAERGVAHRLGEKEGEGWGLLEDQAEFARGLLDLAEVTREGKYLSTASHLLDIALKEYSVAQEGGLLRDMAPRLYDGHALGPLATPSFPLEDTPHISPNSTVVLALLRLATLTGDPKHEARAQPLLSAILSRTHHAGIFAAGAALGAGLLQVPPCRVVVEGTGPAADALYRTAVTTYHPRKVVFRGAPEPPFTLPDEAQASLGGARSAPRAIVCRGLSCLAPITEPAELASVLTGGAEPAR